MDLAVIEASANISHVGRRNHGNMILGVSRKKQLKIRNYQTVNECISAASCPGCRVFEDLIQFKNQMKPRDLQPIIGFPKLCSRITNMNQIDLVLFVVLSRGFKAMLQCQEYII